MNGWIVVSMIVLSILILMFGGCVEKGSPLDIFVTAMSLVENSQNAEALRQLDSAIEKDKEFSLAYSLKGDIYRQMRQYEDSAKAYEKATELNAWSFHDFYHLGNVYQAMMDFQQAANAYARACELDPDNFDAHINAARCYSSLSIYDSTLLFAERAEQLNSEDAELYRILGDAYKGKEDNARTITAYKRVLEIDSSDTEIIILLAAAYLRDKQAQPAKELLLTAMEEMPQNPAVHRQMGYYHLLEYENVAKIYNEQAGQEGVNAQYLETLVSQGKELTDQAIQYYSKAIELDENDWDAHRGLGVSLIINGKQADGTIGSATRLQAIEHWRKSLQIDPDQPNAEKLRQLIAKYKD